MSMKKFMTLSFQGISCGALILCIMLFILPDKQLIINDYPRQFFCAILSGWTFWILSYVYETDISKFMKPVIHMGIGMGVYIGLALYAKWIPTESLSIAFVSICIMFMIAFFIWGCFFFYNYREAKRINHKLHQQ